MEYFWYQHDIPSQFIFYYNTMDSSELKGEEVSSLAYRIRECLAKYHRDAQQAVHAARFPASLLSCGDDSSNSELEVKSGWGLRDEVIREFRLSRRKFVGRVGAMLDVLNVFTEHMPLLHSQKLLQVLLQCMARQPPVDSADIDVLMSAFVRMVDAYCVHEPSVDLATFAVHVQAVWIRKEYVCTPSLLKGLCQCLEAVSAVHGAQHVPERHRMKAPGLGFTGDQWALFVNTLWSANPAQEHALLVFKFVSRVAATFVGQAQWRAQCSALLDLSQRTLAVVLDIPMDVAQLCSFSKSAMHFAAVFAVALRDGNGELLSKFVSVLLAGLEVEEDCIPLSVRVHVLVATAHAALADARIHAWAWTAPGMRALQKCICDGVVRSHEASQLVLLSCIALWTCGRGEATPDKAMLDTLATVEKLLHMRYGPFPHGPSSHDRSTLTELLKIIAKLLGDATGACEALPIVYVKPEDMVHEGDGSSGRPLNKWLHVRFNNDLVGFCTGRLTMMHYTHYETCDDCGSVDE
jgi:hypothetical protein